MNFNIYMEGISVKSQIYKAAAPVTDTNAAATVDMPETIVTKSIDTVDFGDENKNNKKKNILIGIGVGTAIAAYGAVFYRKDIMQWASGFIRKAYLKKEKLIEKGRENTNTIKNLDIWFAQLLDKTLNNSKIFVNFSAIKDSLFDRIARKLKMGKVCDNLAGLWAGLAKNAVKTNYKNCENTLNKTNKAILQTLNDIKNNKKEVSRVVECNGKNYTVGSIIKLIEKNISETNTLYRKEFSLKAFETRNDILNKQLNGVSGKFFDTFSSVDYYKNFDFTHFTVEEWLVPVKSSYRQHIMNKKILISNNIDDKFFSSLSQLEIFDKIIHPADTQSRTILRNAITCLYKYRDAAGKNKNALRISIVEDINKRLDILIEQLKKNPRYKETTLEDMSKLAAKAKESLEMGQKGKLQETMTYLKTILPEKEYRELKCMINNTSRQLNKVANAEGELYFDKLRDIKMGSAFTDILFGMISPLATMGVVLALDDNKNERISTTLKLGIPLIGGIAASTAFLFMLASGVKAMLYSTLTGFLLNRIGSFVDNKISKSRDNAANSSNINSVINTVNLSSEIMSSDVTAMLINRAANKSLDAASKYAYDIYNDYKLRNNGENATVEQENSPESSVTDFLQNNKAVQDA